MTCKWCVALVDGVPATQYTPRMNALTLFAGAGGADLGLRRAGFAHLACVEGDATACATLRAAGFPAAHAWIGGPGPDGQPEWQWDGSSVDLLWASPPCQPYSRAGKRLGASDARDGWPATLATIAEVRPRWVVIENVGGAPVESWASDLGGLFSKCRYPCVSWATLDAADWGLPSHRVRRFLVAGPAPYRWPDPTHAGIGAPSFARQRLRPWVTLGQALNLDDVFILATLSENYKGGNRKIPPCEPAPCVVAIGGHLVIPQGSLKRRRLTWQECATLVGFPTDYPFQGTSEARYRQIGNAVAPVMAEVLGRQISA